MKQRYVIRVYKLKYSFDKYDDNIYLVPESDVDENDILIENWASTIERIIKRWNILIRKYEGYTYCVKDVEQDEILVGGVFDPSDIDYLDEYKED